MPRLPRNTLSFLGHDLRCTPGRSKLHSAGGGACWRRICMARLPVVSDEEFFAAKKAAAVFKHGILRRHLPVFVGRTGSTAPDRRVVVFDGYAGEGRYEDGTDGSPVLMLNTARSMAPARAVELYFCEDDPARFELLKGVLETDGDGVKYVARCGSAEAHLDDVLTHAQGAPLFAFIDPCGLGLTFDDVCRIMRSRPNVPTEVLINFSAEAVRRFWGRLTRNPPGSPGREATLARMDAVCGGEWWREVSENSETAEEASQLIAKGYLGHLAVSSGANGWNIEVRNAEGQKPKYSLVFLSRHPDGIFSFGDAVSMSSADWRKAVVEPGTLLDDDDTFAAAEKELASGWVHQIKHNISALLAHNDSFQIGANYKSVMAGVEGQARVTHVRRAIKELHAAGKTSFNGVSPQGVELWYQAVTK